MRVCQALILPPYQGRGLGRQMLLQVYRVAAERDSVVEVAVEDPAPGFQRQRDAVLLLLLLGELYAEMESRFKSVCRKKWAWISAPCILWLATLLCDRALRQADAQHQTNNLNHEQFMRRRIVLLSNCLLDTLHCLLLA
jgi:GNAT superfamily N-acetyltransferase